MKAKLSEVNNMAYIYIDCKALLICIRVCVGYSVCTMSSNYVYIVQCYNTTSTVTYANISIYLCTCFKLDNKIIRPLNAKLTPVKC